MIKKNKKAVGELTYGIHPLLELLKAKNRKLIAIYTTKPVPKGWALIEKEMPQYPVQIQYVSRDVLTRMAETTDHQGVVSWVQPFPYRKKPFDSKIQKKLVMLDGIQDPRNLGAIIRSAYCTGMDGVVLCKRGAAPLNAVAIKSSAGLAEHMPIYEAASAQSAAQELKQAGYNLYLATLDGADATTCDYKEPMCVVIGGEGFGVTKAIYSMGTRVTLPQKTADISYNASVAAGILMFLVTNKK
jgi:23S rRNA (guanosine2251-2'-O)-methyltransferase